MRYLNVYILFTLISFLSSLLSSLSICFLPESVFLHKKLLHDSHAASKSWRSKYISCVHAQMIIFNTRCLSHPNAIMPYVRLELHCRHRVLFNILLYSVVTRAVVFWRAWSHHSSGTIHYAIQRKKSDFESNWVIEFSALSGQRERYKSTAYDSAALWLVCCVYIICAAVPIDSNSVACAKHKSSPFVIFCDQISGSQCVVCDAVAAVIYLSARECYSN